ncbi:MAG TPA: hypothetical protein PLE70_01185 [Methanolinea sp.]|nr:hypothetical protein [Methanolinea sp.]
MKISHPDYCRIHCPFSLFFIEGGRMGHILPEEISGCRQGVRQRFCNNSIPKKGGLHGQSSPQMTHISLNASLPGHAQSRIERAFRILPLHFSQEIEKSFIFRALEREIHGQVHGNGRKAGEDVSRREKAGNDRDPGNVYLRGVSNLLYVHERER